MKTYSYLMVLQMGLGVFFSSVLTLIGILAIVGKNIVLTYNTITHNYVLISTNTTDEIDEINEVNEVENEEGLTKPPIDKVAFQLYIQTHKPYLNPSLRITELSQGLGVNRTYLSVFINTEYKMNFSSYINQLRMRELQKLQQDESLSELTRTELIERAGFSNYRGYLRSANNENEQFRKRF